MIDNEFIFETNFAFDTVYLLGLVNRAIQYKDIKHHQRLVADDPYLDSIKKQFPILSSKWNFYNLDPNAVLPAHIDAQRNCALNIPLQGTEISNTLFYKSVVPENLVYDTRKVLHWVQNKTEKLYEFTLLKPTLVKNNVPHGVVNGPNRRIILSWSINIDVSFEQAKSIFKDQYIDFKRIPC